MSKRLLLLNVLLGGVCLFCLVFIGQQLVWAPPPGARARSATPSSGPDVAAPGPPRPPSSAYNTIASRSIFSPTRSEAPATPSIGALVPGSRPNLYGVVLRGTNPPIAYIEDPLTKRVGGYHIGDTIAGGKVEAINADSVVISRPDGNIDVRLRDPSKPKPAPPAQPAQPAAPGQPPAPGAPAAPPAAQPVPQPGIVPPRVMAPQQPQAPPINPLIPGRRGWPGLGGRPPVPPAGDTTQQPAQPPQ